MVSTSNNLDEAIIAQSIIAGYHAILSEPYSVDRMYEIAEITNKLNLSANKRENIKRLVC
jgi:hypothetical protein